MKEQWGFPDLGGNFNFPVTVKIERLIAEATFNRKSYRAVELARAILAEIWENEDGVIAQPLILCNTCQQMKFPTCPYPYARESATECNCFTLAEAVRP